MERKEFVRTDFDNYKKRDYMKELLLSLMEKNPGIKFVIMIKNPNEKDEVLEVMDSLGYSPIPPISNKEMLDYYEENYGFPIGVRFKPSDLSVCTASLDHWKLYESDILEVKEGKLKFIE